MPREQVEASIGGFRNVVVDIERVSPNQVRIPIQPQDFGELDDHEKIAVVEHDDVVPNSLAGVRVLPAVNDLSIQTHQMGTLGSA